MKVVRRLLSRQIVREFNQEIVRTAQLYRPDVLLALREPLLRAKTLRALRKLGVRLYNYYPDRIVFARGTELEEALGEYDCVFDTKRSWDGDMARRLRLRDRVFVPHGFDPEVHLPATLSAVERRLFSCDVSFVGTYTARKARILEPLVSAEPKLQYRIFGNGWERCTSSKLRPLVHGMAIEGQSYAKVIAASRVNLAIMGVSDEALDETTMRSYEIPACGGLMLHERTDELLSLYEEGREVACFSGTGELADKVRYYVEHRDEADAIAEAGRRRAVPHYSYEGRMREILAYHRSFAGRQATKNDGLPHQSGPVRELVGA
jgi:hypothetical protein